MESGAIKYMLITIDDYFDLDKIIESGQTFRAKEIEHNLYRFISLGNVLYIAKTNFDDKTYEVSCKKEEWDKFWYNYFDLGRNYSKIKLYDEFATKCFEESKGIRILVQDPLEMLISFIISQRKSIPAIRSSIEKICQRFGTRISTEHENDLYLFPTINQLSKATEDELNECKTGYRTPYIIDAINTLNNNPSFLDKGYCMRDEDLLEHLKTIKGVGTKVANCIALFAYNRLSLAPIDTWINKIIEEYYNGNSPFSKYKENAGIIQQYMFYYAITHKKTI